MAKKVVSHIPESEQNKLSYQYKIQQGLMNSTVYNGLSTDEQNNVKQALFEMYNQPIGNAQALSGLEFILFALAKIFIAKDTGQTLTADQQTWYTNFQNLVSQHEMTMDSTGWWLPYAQNQMLAVKNNRATYKQKKTDITGSF